MMCTVDDSPTSYTSNVLYVWVQVCITTKGGEKKNDEISIDFFFLLSSTIDFNIRYEVSADRGKTTLVLQISFFRGNTTAP